MLPHPYRPVSWRVSGYSERRELDREATGRVVLAGAEVSGAPVAIRYVPVALLNHVVRLGRLRADLAALSGLRHPHVVRLVEYAEDPRLTRLHPWPSAAGRFPAPGGVAAGYGAAVVSGEVAGVPPCLRLRRDGPLSPVAGLVLFRDLLRGLSAGHALGLAHGDVRLTKVLGGVGGRSVLGGFGLGRLTGGPAVYRAPELWGATDLTASSAAADVYAAACVLFTCLTGGPPYGRVQLSSLMSRHRCAPVPVGALPEPVRPLLAAGLAKDPVRRPDAGELAAAVEETGAAVWGASWPEAGTRELGGAVAPPVTGPPSSDTFPHPPRPGADGPKRTPQSPDPDGSARRSSAPR